MNDIAVKGLVLVFLTGIAGTFSFFLVQSDAALTDKLVGGFGFMVAYGIVLTIARGFWSPAGHGAVRVAIASIGAAALFFVAVMPDWKQLALVMLATFYPDASVAVDGIDLYVVITFSLVVIAINYFYFRTPPVIQAHPDRLDGLRQVDDAGLNDLCRALLDDLDVLDDDANWMDGRFTPLEAEFELSKGKRRRRKVVDLIHGMRKTRRARVVVVIGDPGSGKSVALRKLARDLIASVGKSRRIPLYVNLRGWSVPTERAVTDEDLKAYVLATMKERLRVAAFRFLEAHFDALHERGQFFYIIDSFDEAPGVLAEDKDSPRIREIANAVAKLVAGPKDGCGVVASRPFRRPVFAIDEQAQLTIRPFSDRRVAEALLKGVAIEGDRHLIGKLVDERPDLLPSARNPFTAGLIVHFINRTHRLPQRQVDLYRTFLASALARAEAELIAAGLTEEDVGNVATAISLRMMAPRRGEIEGLEASVVSLAADLAPLPVEPVIKVLRKARLARAGEGNLPSFSFVHRRFQEYFLVEHLRTAEVVPVDSAIRDDGWRDALVLFTELAPDEIADAIARRCWQEVGGLRADSISADYRSAVQALRFLVDAFQRRKEIVAPYVDEIFESIRVVLDPESNGDDILTMKIAVEALGILAPQQMVEGLVLALGTRNQWITETAFRACRYVPAVDEGLVRALNVALAGLPSFDVLYRWRDYLFHFTGPFTPVRKTVNVINIENVMLICAVIAIFTIMPVSFMFLAVIFPMYKVIAREHVSIDVLLRDFVLMIGISHAANDVAAIYIRDHNFIQLNQFTDIMIPIPIDFSISIVSGIIAIPVATIKYRKLSIAGVDIRVFLLMAVILVLIMSIAFLVTYIRYVLYFVASAMTIIFITMVLHDIRFFRLVSSTGAPTRADIAAQYLGFKTEYARGRYVDMLERAAVPPDGAWPGGRRPGELSSKSATRLAQLDEKWVMHAAPRLDAEASPEAVTVAAD